MHVLLLLEVCSSWDLYHQTVYVMEFSEMIVFGETFLLEETSIVFVMCIYRYS